MKPTLFTAYTLSVMGLIQPATAEPTTQAADNQFSETEQQNETLKPHVYISSYMETFIKGRDIIIDFKTPMIQDADVNSPVAAEHLDFRYKDSDELINYTATWYSTTSIKLTVTDETRPLNYAVLTVRDLKDTEGKSYEEASITRCTSDGIGVYCASDARPTDQVAFIGAINEQGDKLLAERLDTLHFRYRDNTLPANARPATAGDAVKHWNQYLNHFRNPIDDEDADLAAMKQLPPDTPLPHTWICDIPFYPAYENPLELVFPLGCTEQYGTNYSDSIIGCYSASYPHFSLQSKCLSQGVFRITLDFTIPVKVDELESILNSLEWELRDNEANKISDYTQWENGEITATMRDIPVRITLDKEATLKNARTYKLDDGTEVKAVQEVFMNAETSEYDAPSLFFSCRGNYRAIVTTPLPYHHYDIPYDFTCLKPQSPYIYSDVHSGQMMRHGLTTLNCEYGHIKNGKLNLYKIDSSAGNVARLLNAYSTWYDATENNAYSYDDLKTLKKSKTNRINRMRVVPTEFLPGVQQHISRELPDSSGKLSINLAEEFSRDAGFYFIEMSGESLLKQDKDAPIVNQGLIQVTDLGLLWKLNGNRIFAWGYHLSDGKTITEGCLRMLDLQGNILAETELRNGIAQADFPKNTRFLQLCTPDDSVVIVYDSGQSEYDANGDWMTRQLENLGIPINELPQALVYLFADRSIYRPGETAHIKGMVRWICDNEVKFPQIESITATISCHGDLISTQQITPEADGSFSLDLTTAGVGSHCVEFSVKYKGDDDDTSPDKAALKRHKVEMDDWSVSEMLTSSRERSIYLTVEEFRRNEFELKNELKADLASQSVEMSTTATNFTTTPVADADVEWSMDAHINNFYPKDFQDYRFGDFLDNGWAHFYAYYLNDDSYSMRTLAFACEKGKLDDQGKGSHTFSLVLPDKVNSGPIHITTHAQVTNGNQQSITGTKKLTLHPAEAYVGIKTEERLLKVGNNLPVNLIAVKPDGTTWDGAPLQGSIKVVCKSHKAYRYGSAAISSIQNVEDEEVLIEQPVTYTNTPTELALPLTRTGIYTITAECTDSKGRTVCSKVRHYVWGEGETPWYYRHNTELTLVEDKPMYKAGDTANILVQTPVDAEVLVTVERGDVLRHYKRTITVNNPVIQVPIEAGDAPVIYVGVSMVQSAEKRRKNGAPLIKMGVCSLNVEATDKILNVELTAPQEHLLPQDRCAVSGIVKDAAGNPVANAEVTLYAEDEGTLQVRGYKLPTPEHFFYSEDGRAQGTLTYSALGQLINDSQEGRYMGNKGVFIGGGDCEAEGGGAGGISDEDAAYLRENFTPCAVWLSKVKTDAEGRFSTEYVNPDTMTRYRLMAVAATEDKFGSGETTYHVTKPIMLEPVAPLGSTESDLLHMPVTISMLPKQLAEAANGAEIEWKVSLSGSNVVLPEPEKTVRLSGNKPVTITFPIITPDSGKAELTWSVQAASPTATGTLARCKDAVKLDFNVIPPTPFLRERICRTLKDGQSINLQELLTTQYRAGSPVELSISTSPLSGLRYQIQYLLTYPYGCSEQLSSTVMPWLLKNELQKGLGLEYPQEHNADTVIRETFEKLATRRLGHASYGYWDGSDKPCSFSPYVVLLNQLANEKGYKHLPNCSDYEMQCQYKQLASTALPPDETVAGEMKSLLTASGNSLVAPDMLSVYVLARSGKMVAEDLEPIIDRVRRLKHQDVDTRLMLALCARMLKHPQADTLKMEAMALKQPEYDYSNQLLPPTETIKLLDTIFEAPNSEATAQALREYIDKADIHRYSTWRNAWFTLAVYEYLRISDAQNKSSLINGEQVSMSKPMNVCTTTEQPQSFSNQGTEVYINGYAEGHTQQAQANSAIDNGLRVTRRYEKLMPDGTWVPTGTFEVGDVVKVHLSVASTMGKQQGQMRYLAVEDRLPAAFEAVNPALLSQALPPTVNEEQAADWWYYSHNIDNREFLKDRVRFFSTYFYGGEMKATYVARVLRRGKVTAPAAKAELMYRPEIRGLSVPQQFEVK